MRLEQREFERNLSSIGNDKCHIFEKNKLKKLRAVYSTHRQTADSLRRVIKDFCRLITSACLPASYR
jgi:hypothetical protein